MSGEYDWTLTWTEETSAESITDGSGYTSAAISNDAQLATEISVEITYGATASEGAKVYVLRDGADQYEDVDDNPWGFEMPYSTSTAYQRTFTVPASIGRFKIYVGNDSGATVTLELDYRQSAAAA